MLLLVGAALVSGCGGQTRDAEAPATETLASGIDKSNMDKTVRPQNDFFAYVNGVWLRETEIPADQTSAGGFRDLRENARQDVLAIIQDLAAETDIRPGSDEQKVADLFNSFMDSVRIQTACPAINGSFSVSASSGATRPARRPCATAWPPIRTAPRVTGCWARWPTCRSSTRPAT